MEHARGFAPAAIVFATSLAILVAILVFGGTTEPAESSDDRAASRERQWQAPPHSDTSPDTPPLIVQDTGDAPGVLDQVRATLEDTSLRGTTLDGALHIDEQGRFVRDRHALALFDHIFTLRGERSDEEIRALLVEVIEHHLDGRAADDAIAFLDQYLDYQRAVAERSEVTDADATAAERLTIIRDARRESFGEGAAEVLFGEEEALDAFSLGLRALEEDESLTPEQRIERQRELERELPDSLRDARRETMAPLDAMRAEQELRTMGGSEEDVQHEREQRFGDDAAGRLAELDRQREGFKRRLLEWRAERDRILQDTALGEQAKLRALDEHLTAHFTELERVRVKALDEHGITP